MPCYSVPMQFFIELRYCSFKYASIYPGGLSSQKWNFPNDDASFKAWSHCNALIYEMASMWRMTCWLQTFAYFAISEMHLPYYPRNFSLKSVRSSQQSDFTIVYANNTNPIGDVTYQKRVWKFLQWSLSFIWYVVFIVVLCWAYVKLIVEILLGVRFVYMQMDSSS